MAAQNIGFIGVGRMGGRMARRLIDAGYALIVCDASDAAVAPLVEMGAPCVTQPRRWHRRPKLFWRACLRRPWWKQSRWG